MPDGKLSITEFAAKIKAKYPSYQGVDDVTLTKKIIEKYPDYASSVDMSGSEGVKKKEPSVSQVGGTLGISAAPSGLTEVKVSGGLIPEYKGVVGEVKVDERDPIKSYKNALYTKQNTDLERLLQRERKPKVATTFVAKAAAPAKEKKAEAAKEFVQIKKEEKEKGLLPAYQIDKEVVKVKKTYEQDQNASVAHLMKATGETNPDVIFSLPKEELQRLVRQGNETDEAAVKAISEAQDVKDILGKSSNLEEAALYYGGLKDPQLQGQIDRNIVPGTNRVGNVSSLVSEGSLGRKMYDFLSDPIVQNEIKKNSALNQELKQTVPTLINKYPDFGKAYLGNKISDKMEQMGINNAILNVVTEEETDKAVDELAKEGEMTPNEVQFYKDNLKGKGGITDILRGTIGENYYSTPGALENILGGAVKGTLAIGKGASELTGLRQALLGKTEVNARDISDRDLAVNIAPKGIAHEMSMSGGQFLGQLAPIMFGAELGAAKLGLTAEGANSALFGLQTYANNIAEARRLFPDNQLKQRGFATIASSIDALLLPKIGNNKIVKSVLGEMKPEVANIVNGYATKTLSKEAATEGIENAFLKAVKKVPEAAGYFAKQTGKNTAIMTALDLAHQVNEGVFEGKPAKEWVNGERLFDNARSAAIGSVFLSALGARAEMANKGVTAKLIYQNAERPDVWEAEIKRVGEVEGEPQESIQDKIDNARYASSVFQDLQSKTDMTEKQKAKYILNALVQKAKTKQAESITDPLLRRRAEQEAKNLEKEQEDLLDNKDDGTIEGDVSDVIEGENLIQKKREQEAEAPYEIKLDIPEKSPFAREAEAPLPAEIESLNDNEPVTFTVKNIEEIPEEFRDRAKKREGLEVKSRKTILGIPVGKETTEIIGEGYNYTITGKEAKDYALRQQEAEAPLPAEEKITEEVKTPVGEEVVEEKGEVAPIRQLGTGANVYFENEKYRVNDSKDKVLLNVQGTGDTGVIANLEFQTPKEAVEVARELNRLYPNGVPEAVLLDKVVEDIKTGKYKEEVPVTEEIKTKREVEPKKAEVTSPLKDVESTVKALKEKRLKKGKYEILQAKLEPTDDSSKVVYQYAESDSPSDVKEFPGYFYSKTPSDRISITDSSNGYKIVEGANKKEALQKFKDLIDKKGGFESLKKQSEEIVDKRERAFAEKYHKAKKDGSSPDLVKSIEDLLGGEAKVEPSLPSEEKPIKVEGEVEPLQKLEEEYRSKSVDELVALKKKLYSNVDIETPFTPEEKLLNKVIADKYSEINQAIVEKRKAEKAKEEAGWKPVEMEGEEAPFGETAPKEEKKEKAEKDIRKRALNVEASTPRSVVLQYFIGGGKISPDAIKKIFGRGERADTLRWKKKGIGEQRASMNLQNKNALGLDALAHKLWEANREMGESTDFREAIEDVLGSHSGTKTMAEEMVNSYDNDYKQMLREDERAAIAEQAHKELQDIASRIPEPIRKEIIDLLDNFRDNDGFVDWNKLEEASNGFDANILNLSPESSKFIDNAINQVKQTGRFSGIPGEVLPEAAKAGDALRSFANKVRDGKISKLGGFRAGTGFDQVWDASLEIIAKAIDGGASIADAIEAGLKYAKSTGWYKKLQNQADFDKKYREHLNTEYNAVQKPSAGEVLQRPQEGAGEAGGKRGGMEQGVKGAEVTEEGKVEGKKGEEVVPPVPPTETKVFEEELPSEMSGIAHAETEKMRTALGLPEYERVTGKSDRELDAEAQEQIKKGYNVEKLIKSIEEGNPPTGVENYILARYKGALEKEFERTQSDDVLNKLKRLSDATDFIGTKQSESFRTRKALVPKEETLSQYFLDEMADAGVDKLTEQQKAVVTEEYKAINEAKEALQKKVEELQAENAKLKAQDAINKDKKAAPKKVRKTDQEFTEERKQIITDIRAKLKKARGQAQSSVVPYANELITIAPDVAKLAKSLIEQGVVKLEELAVRIKDELKEDIKDITEKDVIDILAGEYTEKKNTKNQLSEKLKDLRDQAKLINKLADLENGEVPKTERKKIERNREIKELRDKIREHDLTKLSEVKNRMKSQIEKIEKDLREGNFDKEPEKREIVLDKEGKELKSKFLELRKQREVRRLKTQYEQRTKKQKAIDKVVEVFNIPRSVMASTDFSAPLNQAFIATINYPKEAKAAAEQMIKSTFSQKAFDEWFYELKDDSRYDLMKELKLGISDPHSPFLTAREEAFMSGMAERVPVVGEFIKGSERAYVQYLNKLRVDLFNRFVDRFESQGKTYKNSPELYDATTKYINNITGKGDLGKLDQFAPVFNALMFSPRLMASRINLLNPYYFAKLPKELKIQYAKDMGATLALGSTLLSLFALYGMTQKDDDPKKIKVETDPRSTDFGRIRQGNTRWDIWGGFQPYVRLAAQVGYGERKSSNTGLIQSLDGEGAFGQTRGDVLSTFARGKLAPVPAMAIDLIQGRNAMGEKVELKDELLSHIIPLSSQAIAEGVKEYGPKGAVLAGLPAVFGVGVQSYSQKPKEVKGEIEWRDRKIKLNDEEKKFFQNKYNEISKINLDKLSALPEYKQADLETQAGLRSLVQKASMKKAEDILTRRYASKFRLVKREGNEEEKKIDVIKRKLRLK